MKNILLLIIVIVFMLSSSMLMAQQIEVPTVEYLFKSKKSEIPMKGYVYGCIVRIEYSEPDLFTNEKTIDAIIIGGNYGTIDVYVDYPEGKYKIGECVVVQTSRGIMLRVDNKTGFGAGKVAEGSFKIIEWSDNQKIPSYKSTLTVDEYFEDGIQYGNRRITIIGIVFQIEAEMDLIIDLRSSEGKIIRCFYNYWVWKDNEKLKTQIRKIKAGQQIALKGYFNMEIVGVHIFSITSIVSE